MKIDAASSGYQIIQNAQQQVSKSSQVLAEAATGAEPAQKQVTRALVNLNQAEIYAKSGVKVIQTESEMLGILLDLKA